MVSIKPGGALAGGNCQPSQPFCNCPLDRSIKQPIHDLTEIHWQRPTPGSEIFRQRDIDRGPGGLEARGVPTGSAALSTTMRADGHPA